MRAANEMIDAAIETISMFIAVVWANVTTGLETIGDWLAGRL
jgi:hypothetical protein